LNGVLDTVIIIPTEKKKKKRKEERKKKVWEPLRTAVCMALRREKAGRAKFPSPYICPQRWAIRAVFHFPGLS